MNENVKLALQMLSGGAIGALITAFVNVQRSKVPKIWYDAEVETLYDKSTSIGKYEIEVLLKNTDDNGNLVLNTCENAHIFRLKLKNTSNHSFGKFEFGINFPKSMKPLVVKPIALDRKHSINSATEIGPNSNLYDLDFSIIPFNRHDVAEIQILFTKSSSDDSIPQIITSEDARLINNTAMKKNAYDIFTNIIMKSAFHHFA